MSSTASGDHVAAPSFDGIFHLDEVGDDTFQGSTPTGVFALQSIYGGQLIAQAMLAADRTAGGRHCHSLHAYYIRAGDPLAPVTYTVERVRDGRSFATRQVTASQAGRTVLSLIASFKQPELGPVHQDRMPDVLPPDALPPGGHPALWEAPFSGLPMEIRRASPTQQPPPMGCPAHQRLWFRAAAPFTDGQSAQQAALAYVSDMGLLSTTMLPHGLAWRGEKAISSSLDHALWFHRPSDIHQWHLYDQQSPSAGDARGFGLGSIWTHNGVLVANVAQEGLLRVP